MNPLTLHEIINNENNTKNIYKIKTKLNNCVLKTKKRNLINNYFLESAETFLKRLDNNSVDLFILDPPYFRVVKNKWDNQWKSFKDYYFWFNLIIKIISIKAKNSCSLWLFGFPYQLNKLISILEKHGFTFKQDIIIYKGLQSISGRSGKNLKMFPTATEHIFFFFKESRHKIRQILNQNKKLKKYTSEQINKILGKAFNGGGTWSSIAGPKQKNIQYPTKKDWLILNKAFNDKLPNYNDLVYKFNLESGITDVWSDIKFYGKNNWIIPKKHPTQKPYKLIERIIKCSSNKGNLIVDCFAGTGTTFKVSKDLKRNYSGCEINKKYFLEIKNSIK